MKKFLALLLAVVMVIGLVACGKKDTPASTTAPAAGGNTNAATEPKAEELEPVTLKMWFHGSNVKKDASDKVMAELNAYLKDKINVTLEPIWGTWGDFDTTVPNALTANQDVDIVFTCNWSANEYNKFARDGYYVKLDDMLDTYASDLKATIPQGIWDCAKTEGMDGLGIYAVPGLKDTATQNCWDVNATLLKELGFEVPEKLDYFSDEFKAMCQAAKDKKGADFYPLVVEAAVLERMVNHSSIITGDIASFNLLSYYYDAEDPSKDTGATIVNKFATPEFEKFAAKTYEYAQAGFIAPKCMDAAQANDYRGVATSAGDYLFCTQVYAFGCELDFSNARGFEVAMVPETAPYMDCTSGQGAMMAITKASKNPERALMFLNLLNTDPAVMTFVNYGVEGFTYDKNDDGTIAFIPEGRDNYTPWTNGVGNVRILPPTADQGTDFWNRFAAYYDTAKTLPYGGFIFNNEPVKIEVTSLGTVLDKYAFNLCCGAVDPATELPKFLEELNTAGAETFVNEANTQLTAFVG